MRTPNPCNNERGMVLVIGLIFLALLTMFGTAAYMTTSNETDVSRNYRLSKTALYNADAGIQYGLALVETGLNDDTLTLPANVGDTITLAYTAPTGFDFTLSTIAKTAANAYSLTSIGGASGGSQAQISVSFMRETEGAMQFAAFGETSVNGFPSSEVYSYDSTDALPDPPNLGWASTGNGDLGSNNHIDLNNVTAVDGEAYLGEDAAGNPATIDDPFNQIPAGDEHQVDRIDPDPLGINDPGGPYNPATYSASNDNGTIPAAHAGGSLTLCGKPGGANYYFTDLKLNNGDTLTVDTDGSAGCATTGQVNIFVNNPSGYIDLKASSTVNITGKATDFTLFSNTTGKIDLKHEGSFTGLLYAPGAAVETKNSAVLFGAIWADSVDVKNSSVLYYDEALMDEYLVESDDVAITAWQNVRN